MKVKLLLHYAICREDLQLPASHSKGFAAGVVAVLQGFRRVWQRWYARHDRLDRRLDPEFH